MKNLVFKFFLLEIVLIVSNVVSQSNNFDSNSKFISNSLRSNDESMVRNYDNLTSIEDILELFSINVIGSRWKAVHNKVNPICAQHMMEYLNGLERKKIWAIKSKYRKSRLQMVHSLIFIKRFFAPRLLQPY